MLDTKTGAVALRQCYNPCCLAQRGERHAAECIPAPEPREIWSGSEDWS